MRVVTENTIGRLSDASVVTIGNFDGVHSGHKALIARCRELLAPGHELVVVSFEPLPAAWFRPDVAPARLSSVKQKISLLEKSGIDLLWLMRFNQELAEMTARKFVRQVLVESLSARHVVTGKDFRFGHNRAGDRKLLEQMGSEHGFATSVIEDLLQGETRISSTAIRRALASGDLAGARQMLGHSFCMEGDVIRGEGLGRKLGFPTANLRLEANPSPLAGVFAVRARLMPDGEFLPAVASLGNRPVVDGKEFLVEVHLFNFDEDLYGQRLEVKFEGKLRDEEDFSSIDELVEQMKIDAEQARQMLKATL